MTIPTSQVLVASLKIKEMPSRERPRERLRSLGAQALSTTELIATVLGSGGKGSSALSCAQLVLEQVQVHRVAC